MSGLVLFLLISCTDNDESYQKPDESTKTQIEWPSLDHVNKGFNHIYQQMDRYSSAAPVNEIGMIPSYETIVGIEDPDLYIKSAAFSYDNALVLIALLARGDTEDIRRARLLADTFVYVLNNDRYFTDGRIRNAYMAEDLVNSETGKANLPGWWDSTENVWREDELQVSTHSGNMAWTIIALLHFYTQVDSDGGVQNTYLVSALTLANWIETETRDNRGSGGYIGGYQGWEPNPAKIMEKSAEQNLDIFIAFSWLFNITGDSQWQSRAQHAKAFVESMWNQADGYFWAGTASDGVTVNSNYIPTDVQAWAVLAFPNYSTALDWTNDNTSVRSNEFNGFDFNNDRDGVWFEGTAQMVTAFQHTAAANNNYQQLADDYLLQLRKAQAEAPNTNGLGIVASSIDGLTTGLDWLYYSRLHIGTTAWYLLAELGAHPWQAPPLQ
jgi:hypothetical protein